jgi:hypothetical protein
MTLVLRGMLKAHIPAGSPEPPKLVSKNYDCRNCRSGDLEVFFSAPKPFSIMDFKIHF